ncbi:VirB4-like conjugal transfer ATPase, CD1110 family [Peptoniphilus lacydonensis]|uniref:VirB4-like conjugal transfer ATPase, CD1110 family n=1 Tax=Peptoniphilus lacydonensis TaxID=1673725 RepID=UPI002910E9C6|nr:BRO family protein [Peptoniphilus lacydonensis]MDU5437336.1 BRO family protein [Peptoniphilus lacydonensis]
MISNLKTFENKNFGKLTVIEKYGEFFFISNEVATMLGYVNPRKAVYDHVDEEDKGVTKWNTPGGIQNISIINESGLYSLILSSIDRCLPKIYQKYFEDPKPENMPILGDLYDMLLSQEEVVGRKLATEMEIYVKGSLNVFNNRSNVDLNRQLLCFDIKELGTQLKKIGMLVIQDQVWNKVSLNRGSKSTRYYIDEFHLLLKDPQTASYSVEIWKRFRKWGGIPTGITQNVKDLLTSQEIENIFDNTDFVLMLNQASGDRDILAKKLKISPYQLNYITNSNAGEGLLFFGNTIVPFIDKFHKDTMLYKLMTTKPEEAK